jgi:hypothetical protein
MYEYNNESLTFIERNDHEIKLKKKNNLIIILSIVCLSLLYFNYLAYSMLGDYQKKEHQIEVLNDSIQKKNLKTVDSYIESLPFKNKNLVKKQYRLESNYLKSSLVRTNLNLFGMKASSRKHTYKNIKNGYANYSTWQMSVLDRLMYDIYVGTSLKGYAEDSRYFQKLNNIKLR